MTLELDIRAAEIREGDELQCSPSFRTVTAVAEDRNVVVDLEPDAGEWEDFDVLDPREFVVVRREVAA